MKEGPMPNLLNFKTLEAYRRPKISSEDIGPFLRMTLLINCIEYVVSIKEELICEAKELLLQMPRDDLNKKSMR